jgi:energy-converting hydrogenase Eha subunit A
MKYICSLMSSFFKINLDFAGLAASMVCAIHCIAMPVLLSLGLMNGSQFMGNHYFDTFIIALGILIASLSLLGDYKIHRSKLPLGLIVLGFTVLIIGLKLGHDLPHVLMSVIGSSFVASAHFINWKKSKQLQQRITSLASPQ